MWGHAQKTPLKGMRFETLEEAQAYLDNWETRWADTRIHGTTKRQVAAMFAEEKPALQPLPIEPFRYYQYGERVVHLDVASRSKRLSTVCRQDGSVDSSRCSGIICAFESWIPKPHELLREHVRQERGRHRIHPEDRPKKMPLTTVQLLARASRAGTHIGIFCEQIHRHQGEAGVRRILGVLSLAKKFGAVATDDACTAALELCTYEYRFVRRYLERRPQLSLKQVDPLIRELIQYRDLINLKTEDNTHEPH